MLRLSTVSPNCVGPKVPTAGRKSRSCLRFPLASTKLPHERTKQNPKFPPFPVKLFKAIEMSVPLPDQFLTQSIVGAEQGEIPSDTSKETVICF